jgi:hypothetical protein
MKDAMMHLLLLLITTLFTQDLRPLTVERVILSTNDNANYKEFWPDVAVWWRKLIGIQKITLAVIGNEIKLEKIDQDTDILYFPEIQGVPTGRHAQLIRLLLPALYPDEGCIISDIDMMPISKFFLKELAEYLPDNEFIVYRRYGDYYRNNKIDRTYERYPMCYVAGKGNVFREIFRVTNKADIERKIASWRSIRSEWLDEILLYKAVQQWKHFNAQCTCGDIEIYERSINRELKFGLDLLKSGYYIDCNLPRPYSVYKKNIQQLFELIVSFDSCPA